MIIIYRPEEGEEQRWDLSQTKIMSVEAEQIERLTDLTWNQVRDRLARGSMTALRAMAYVLAKRVQPTLRYSQFNPPADGLDWDLDATELTALREDIAAEDGDPAEKAQALADLDELIAKRTPPADAAAEDTELVPKDSAPEASPTVA